MQKERPIESVETKFIGLSVALPLHREIRKAAEEKGISATELYREALLHYLDERKVKK
jgi:hypothetical protein